MTDPRHRRPEDEAQVGPLAAALTGDDGPLLVGLPAVAGTFVFAVPLIGWWAVAVAALVYAVGYRAYEVYRHMALAREQLVTTLELLPEAAGQISPGRGRRAGATADLIADALGLADRAREAVVTAARCRGVGRLGCADVGDLRQAPSGSTGPDSSASGFSVSATPGFDPVAVARWGAAVVGSVGALAPAAALIDPGPEEDPFRRRLRAIIEVAWGYDEATREMGLDPEDAVELLRATSPPEAAPALGALSVVVAPAEGRGHPLVYSSGVGG